MNRNYFDDWADEYLETARKTKENIEKCRQEMRDADKSEMVISYDRKILSLWEAYDNLMRVADILRRKAAILRFREEKNSK